MEPTAKHFKSIFLSDIHLGTKGCQSERLLDFLYKYSCDKLYLVGDIIDGWKLEQRIYWPQEHTNVIRKFLSFAKNGTEVFYVTGNHDEFLRSFSPLNLGNIKMVDKVEHITDNGRKILVVHGDEFDLVTNHSKWVSVFGSWVYEFLISMNTVINFVRRIFGVKNYWSFSAYIKYKVKNAVNFISKYETTLVNVCKKKSYDGVICGHIHHAAIEDYEGITYHNCGDWVESCTALVEDHNGNISLIDYSKENLTINLKRILTAEKAA